MEPRQQGLQRGPERGPVSTGGYESGSSIEAAPGSAFERAAEHRPEVIAVQAEAAQIAAPTLPTPVISAPSPVSVQPDDNALPDVAADDDLIEKEWVDKVKKVITETKDDPYRREQEINKLQIEYIRRRYGREIGDAGE